MWLTRTPSPFIDIFFSCATSWLCNSIFWPYFIRNCCQWIPKWSKMKKIYILKWQWNGEHDSDQRPQYVKITRIFKHFRAFSIWSDYFIWITRVMNVLLILYFIVFNLIEWEKCFCIVQCTWCIDCSMMTNSIKSFDRARARDVKIKNIINKTFIHVASI